MLVVQQWRLSPSTNMSLGFVAKQQIVTERQSNNLASNMEVHMKQRCADEYFHMKKKIASIGILWFLMNIHGDQTMDVSTVSL